MKSQDQGKELEEKKWPLLKLRTTGSKMWNKKEASPHWKINHRDKR